MIDMDWLEPDDQITVWVGRVARLETEIEAVLGVVYESMLGHGPAWSIVPRMSGPKVKGLRAMLKVSNLDADLIDDALGALLRIETALSMRNDAVHGRWAVEQPETPEIFVQQPKGSHAPASKVEWDLTTFEECHRVMMTAKVTAGALMFAIAYDRNGGLSEPVRASVREQLAGRIIVGEDGVSVSFTDSAFETRITELMAVQTADFRDRWAGDESAPVPEEFDE